MPIVLFLFHIFFEREKTKTKVNQIQLLLKWLTVRRNQRKETTKQIALKISA